MTDVRIVKEPTVHLIAQMRLNPVGLEGLVDWVREYRPECLPEDYKGTDDLFPHDPHDLDNFVTDNELLVELAGRGCYLSFGKKAGRKSNREYIAHTQSGDIPHGSIMYHAKMSFFVAGISRRVSHELIRHYVGADRDEEGSPSQQSTRYVDHPGHYVLPPGLVDQEEYFTADMQQAHNRYEAMIARLQSIFIQENDRKPVGIERKRIREAAAGLLPGQAATSFIWTTNPIAFAKMCRERANEAADAEFQRLMVKWKKLAVSEFPNLFCQPWMEE